MNSKKIRVGDVLKYLNNKHVFLYLFLLVFSYYLIDLIIQGNRLVFYRPVIVTLRAPNGLLLSVNPENSGSITADKMETGEWESFHASWIDSARLSLHDPWDRHLIISGGSEIIAHTTSSRDPIFMLSLLPNNKGTISDSTGHFWCFSKEKNTIIYGKQAETSLFSITLIDPAFSGNQLALFGIAIVSLLAGLIIFGRATWNPFAIVALMAAAFCYHLYAITFYDFLFPWDEQYHAVVARSMVENPWKPMFYKNPLIPYPELYKIWVACNVWLHKQPLFMWQMAFFINIFGEQPWVIRIPDLIANTLLVWIIYRIGTIVMSKRVGFVAAFLFSGSYFLFSLTTGSQFTDHNDVIFLFYITLSIWAFLEYSSRSMRKWQIVFALLAGIFAGCAVLNKWLVGLLVFSGWGVFIFISRTRRSDIKRYLDIGLSILICCLVFVPWQIYIINEFPLESWYEFGLNTQHFFTAVEGHAGDNLGWLYHLVRIPRTFGLSSVFVVICLLFFVFLIKNNGLRWAIVTWILIVFLFYSIAMTKMPAFTFIVAPLIYICVATLMIYIKNFIDIITPRKIVATVFFFSLMLYIGSMIFDLNSLVNQNYYWARNPASGIPERQKFADAFRKLNREVSSDEQRNYVIFNCPIDEIGQGLFFTDVRILYPPLDKYNLKLLKEYSDFPIRYLKYDDQPIPDYIKNDSSILLLPLNGMDFIDHN